MRCRWGPSYAVSGRRYERVGPLLLAPPIYIATRQASAVHCERYAHIERAFMEPALAPRLFLRKLRMELKIPVLALVDSDPYGLKILAVYMKGAAHLSQALQGSMRRSSFLLCAVRCAFVELSRTLHMGLELYLLVRR